jgi:hypothetical protein
VTQRGGDYLETIIVQYELLAVAARFFAAAKREEKSPSAAPDGLDILFFIAKVGFITIEEA